MFLSLDKHEIVYTDICETIANMSLNFFFSIMKNQNKSIPNFQKNTLKSGINWTIKETKVNSLLCELYTLFYVITKNTKWQGNIVFFN